MCFISYIFQVLVRPVLLTVMTHLLIACSVNSFPSNSASNVQNTEAFVRSREYKDPSKNDAYGLSVHPCFNTTVNHTVITPEGEKVLCLVPSEQELMKELEAIGGFNRRYVAVTMEEAEKYFEDPFEDQSKPWSSDVTGRRRRSIDEKEYNADDHGRVKRSVSVGLQSCETTKDEPSRGFFQLCLECQWITKLPNDKFPRYINEKICGRNGNRFSTFGGPCNKGAGMCLQQSETQDLLIKTNRYQQIPSPDPQYSVVYKQVWDTYGQKIRSCCQCQNWTP